ncbi:hypothetical protein JOB18_011272 [Solea senegalensis]|uniref:Uncharacterized protein n=1 Tax=Solea senegalensis TaxID=28829 RepID=A0AAV6RUP3_SOLSE|nr:hypothetical protein JOB18_011272 [Solea senegalensis]
MKLISEQQFLMVRPVIDAVLQRWHLSRNCLFKLRGAQNPGQLPSIRRVLEHAKFQVLSKVLNPGLSRGFALNPSRTQTTVLSKNDQPLHPPTVQSTVKKAGRSVSVGEILGPIIILLIISCADISISISISPAPDRLQCETLRFLDGFFLLWIIVVLIRRTSKQAALVCNVCKKSSFRSVSEAGAQTMGQGAEPAMKFVCFNPGSRLKEESQEAALIH